MARHWISIGVVSTAAGLLIAGCTAPRPAPVIERAPQAKPAAPAKPAPSVKAPVPAESRPAFHTVKKGETLYSIALEYGLDYRELAQWNGIDPTRLQTGQQLRLTPPDTTVGRDTLALVARGDVSGMSFTFSVIRPDGERFERRDGGLVRIVSDMVLHEVSVVTFPSYDATDVQVARRSLEAFKVGAGRRLAWLSAHQRIW